MLWLRALIFTVLVPGSVAVLAPWTIYNGSALAGSWWQAGWPLVIAGATIYLLCLLTFLAENGTPAIFFTRALRSVLGEEPGTLVRGGLYRYSRNPMYVGVLAVVFGQAILFASLALTVYGVVLFAAFDMVVAFLEEPHLKARDPFAFEAYSRTTPRWLGLRHQKSHQ
jgi:protein-S-isoprenylcysteine O-methyltransferase Ste14